VGRRQRFNLDRWKGMDDKARETLLWGGSHMTADITWNYIQRRRRDPGFSRAARRNSSARAEAWWQRLQEFVKQGISNRPRRCFKGYYNVVRAEEIALAFPLCFEKWKRSRRSTSDSSDRAPALY